MIQQLWLIWGIEISKDEIDLFRKAMQTLSTEHLNVSKHSTNKIVELIIVVPNYIHQICLCRQSKVHTKALNRSIDKQNVFSFFSLIRKLFSIQKSYDE